MWILKTIYSTILDALFPLSPAEQVLSTYTPEQAYVVLPRAPKVPISDATSVFAYKDERVAKLVWNIKYKKSKHAVGLGGYALYQRLLTMGLPVGSMVIPIPITSKRRRERGYNQCELLVEEIRRLDVDGHFIIQNDLLIRTQHSSRQTLKGRVDRLESARGIFSLHDKTYNEKTGAGKTGSEKTGTGKNGAGKTDGEILGMQKLNVIINIIIVDDVITTGSTIKEAMETFKKEGFANVLGLSLAH